MGKKLKCWEHFNCVEKACPVYEVKEEKCWLIEGTHCRKEIQGKFLEKIEMCLDCQVFKSNIDADSIENTLQVVNQQFCEFRKMVDDRDRELQNANLEMAVGLSEVFEALQSIASGNPETRVVESSKLELIRKLKHLINLTAENLTEIVTLSHEFAMGLAEHFDVLLRVSDGQLSARVKGRSKIELLESLKHVTNEMIESVSREITERKRAESALRASESQLKESEERYHTLFDYDPNSKFVLESGTFNILDVNERCLEVYGYEKKELIGHSFLGLGEAEYSDGILSQSNPGPYSRCDVYTKIRHFKKNGTPFYVNIYICSRKQSYKYGIIATTVDINESLIKETQLIQAGKMSTLGEMATGVAHELNQPLSTIQIGADFLANLVIEGQEITHDQVALISGQMVEQVGRAVSIINHLREFGRTSHVSWEKIDINKPLAGVFTLLGQQLKVRGIKVVSEFNHDLPFILADSNRLEQVFIDVIVNARDAMVEKKQKEVEQDIETTLTVRTFKKNGEVGVSISDTGVGIPEEIRDKIFNPFFTTKKVGEGTGLGLSISYGIVKEYNGLIDVESEVGKGTTFTFYFPACDERS